MQIDSLNSQIEFGKKPAEVAGKTKETKVEIQRDLPSERETKNKQTENLSELKSTLAEYNISLNFSRDDNTNQLVVKLVDSKTGEAIRQTPTEVSLKLAANNVKIQGQFLDKRV